MYDFDHDFEEITEIFLYHKYAKVSMSNDDFTAMLDYFNFIEHRTRYKIGPINYFKKKYLLGTLFKRYL